MSNEKTKADFDKKMDTNVDFKDEDFKYYASKGDKFVEKIKKKGAIMELLEPRARAFINVP